MIRNNNKTLYIWGIIITTIVIIFDIIYYSLHTKYKLFFIFLYIIEGNSFIPIPHEPVVIYYGNIYNPFVVSTICGLAFCVSAIIDIIFWGKFLNHQKLEKVKQNKIYKAVEYYFNLTPFWILVIVAFTPIPSFPFRAIAIISGYSRFKYILSTLVGRTPRYYIYALLGRAFSIPTKYLILLFIVMIIPTIIKMIRDKRIIPEEN